MKAYRLADDLYVEVQQYPTDGFQLRLTEWNAEQGEWLDIYDRRMIGYTVPSGIVEALTLKDYDFPRALEALDRAGISWTEEDFD